MSDIARLLAGEKDKFLFSLFKKYGYNKTKVMKLFAKKRLSIIRMGNREIYCIDDVPVFKLVTLVHTEDSSCKVTYSFKEVPLNENTH